jgi:hypothetical protein
MSRRPMKPEAPVIAIFIRPDFSVVRGDSGRQKAG